MSTIRTLAILSTAAFAVFAGQVQAGGRPSVALGCDISSKEFAGPVTIKNTSGKTFAAGTVVIVKVTTAYGTESETVIVKSTLAPGATMKGNNTYQNTTGKCTAAAYLKNGGYGYPKGS